MSGIIALMNPALSSQHVRYRISTPVFEGPLDLLLHLIERAELDITKLALAFVTDQFLAYLQNLPSLSADEVSSFLVIAAKLLQIKSEALLPRPIERDEGEDDPGEALARQLREYKKYKNIANLLGSYEEQGRRTYLRLAPLPRVEAKLDLTGITLTDLVEVAQNLLINLDLRSDLKTVVTPSPITIRQKIRLITRALREKGRTTFHTLLKGLHTRLDVVVTFIAMLELIKQNMVEARQEKLFGDIEIELADTWDENQEFELEFGE